MPADNYFRQIEAWLMPKILVVDDDPSLVKILRLALEAIGFDIITAPNARAAREQVRTRQPDLILLDLVLPDTDGMVLLPTLRRDTSVPIIVLSARGTQADHVISRKFGADDFLDKPFDIEELDARIAAVLRRCTRTSIQADGECGSLSVTDAGGARIAGVAFHLTPTEHNLLKALVAGQGETISQSALAETLWGFEDLGTSHLVDMHISRLRSRLRQQRGAPIITTARGHGFFIQAGGGSAWL